MNFYAATSASCIKYLGVIFRKLKATLLGLLLALRIQSLLLASLDLLLEKVFYRQTDRKK
jgi:hypothetical protein